MRLVPDKRLRGNSGDVMLPGEQIYGANVVPRGSREQAQVLVEGVLGPTPYLTSGRLPTSGVCDQNSGWRWTDNFIEAGRGNWRDRPPVVISKERGLPFIAVGGGRYLELLERLEKAPFVW